MHSGLTLDATTTMHNIHLGDTSLSQRMPPACYMRTGTNNNSKKAAMQIRVIAHHSRIGSDHGYHSIWSLFFFSVENKNTFDHLYTAMRPTSVSALIIIKIGSTLDVARVEVLCFMEKHSHVGAGAKTLDIVTYGLSHLRVLIFQ
jgi:hypothetical protein